MTAIRVQAAAPPPSSTSSTPSAGRVNARQGVAIAQAQTHAQDYVTLQKSLGLGWETPAARRGLIGCESGTSRRVS